jgi:hypothetical protein
LKNLAARSIVLFAFVALCPAAAYAAPSVTIQSSTLTPAPGETVSFSGKSSSKISSWDWDFDYTGGDPAYDAHGKDVAHAFPRGKHIVVLVVRDKDDNWGYSWVRVTSDRLEPSIAMEPARPNPGQAVTLRPVVPFPDGGSVEAYNWDLDGDGAFDDSTQPTATVSYDKTGSYTVGLQVTDDLDTTATQQRSFEVVEAPPAPQGGSGDLGSGSGSAPAQALLPSSTRHRLLNPQPFIRIKGRTTGRGARIDLFSVRAPAGSRISLRCQGKGCPVGVARGRVRGKRTRTIRFRAVESWLRAGIVLEVRVMKQGYVGRYTRFRIGRLEPPVRWDACVTPGSKGPTAC